jgi:murein DD-endopeptidase MepM/ murein hydrolase activator NlpD
MNPVKGNSQFHSGLDIAARPGTPVRVTADGIVSFSGRSGSNGNLVAVEHGFGYTTYYAHNKKIDVKVGQVVSRGDVIAYVGSTGSTTGPHLHYEIWKNGDSVDPQPYVKGGNR